MMELKEPKRKRRVPPIVQQSFPIPVGGISAISAGHWQIYYGSYLGDCVVVEDPNDMAALYSKGFFGKGSLSRDMPAFQKGASKTPIFIRQRQWERRRTWAKKQQVVVSKIQQMFAQENKQKISDSVSRIPFKDKCHSSLGEPSKEDIDVSEKAAIENRTVASDKTDKHHEGTEHTTTNLSDKPEMETELVVLESEDEVKEAVKSTEKNYDVILLDSEEDEAISVVDEAGSSRGVKTSKYTEQTVASNVSQGKSASGKEVNVASEDSEDSIILNESEKKSEIISVEETTVKLSDVMDNDASRSHCKRGSEMMDDITVPQDKKRRLSGKDKVEIEDVSVKKPETTAEKCDASRQGEVILIDMEECSKEGLEEEVKQKEVDSNTAANESVSGENGAKEKPESDKERELDRGQDTVTEATVPLSNKNAEETVVPACSVEPASEPKPSAECEVSNTMETNSTTCDENAEDAQRNKHVAELDAPNSDNVTATEKASNPEKTKSIHSSAEATVHMEVETSDHITKDADKDKVEADNENESTNGDDEDLVLVLSDGDSDSEEFVKNLNPRLEKEMYPVRETLQLMLEEAFFLSFGLGCLQVVDMCGNILSLTEMWKLFRKSDASFTSKYVAYHYFRSKGWVVKPGLKFGGDFLLYKQGPAFYHSSYVVIVETLNGTSWIQDDKDSKSLTRRALHGLVRLAESSGKEILLCQVIKPPDVTQEGMDSPSIISKFKVNEQLIRRWVSSEEREDDDDTE